MGFGDDTESFMVTFSFGIFCRFFGYFGFCFQRYTRPYNTSRLGAHLALEFTRIRACTVSYGPALCLGDWCPPGFTPPSFSVEVPPRC